MNQFFNTLFSAMRAKITPLWTKFRLWITPTFWLTRGVSALRGFFFKLFDIKPRNKKDYYPLGGWLISRRLAFALTVTLGVVAVFYIIAMSPVSSAFSPSSGSQIPTYKYTSLALKFHTGEVQILARDGHIAYIGQVKDGRASGQGRLFDPQDALIYVGSFLSNMYEGTGELYYENGNLRYAGEFSKNLFHGIGVHYRLSGTLEYQGGYAAGLKSGPGELFNAGGNKIFSGTFQSDELVYAEFVGKAVSEAAKLYLGDSLTYSSSDEHCVVMTEIDAVYSAISGENSLDEEWTVGAVYVLKDGLTLGGRILKTTSDLTASLGAPDYSGQTYLTLPDAVALNSLTQNLIEPIEIRQSAVFDDVFNVSGYDEDRQVYLRVYKTDGLTYTFFSESSNSEGFLMYSIEP